MKTKTYKKHFGLNTVDPTYDIKDTESPDQRNGDFSELGVFKTRAGMSKVSSSAQSSYPVYAIFGFVAEDDVEKRIALLNNGSVVTW